ncbi:superoxide dismutase family protein [Brevibacillus formosus]|uniref:superoxide dismutase family protein n=1 Tax=Brevibacillus TaxID=55080 RepID=UPI000D0F4061|nr:MULTISPECIES: superoxide dismutase family protein [Brevibacillus]MBG9941426.1 superoxide dismutase [Brevibacillus formosus]MED1948816.1 superoxide dismutase family protein [Brevibacillus formosus]MED2001339.1 superoxide dismutase family protein [Brevibacillus formosus]MED2085423.1 superoxide dismutase family protein [Brevibacillus formosus]PSK20773.1 superoxide dismutase [Brevibacillus sp. NRRL NRS-603]
MYGCQPYEYPYEHDLRAVSSQHGRRKGQSFAEIQGGPLAPNLHGYVVFTDVPYGTEVFVEVSGLPAFQPATGNQPQIGPFGFHLHEHGVCTVGNPEDPFTAAGSHWNPTQQPHGNHVGDFPVLFSNDGYARMTFFTNKISAADVVGRSLIIHQSPDDFRSQPAGNSGKRLACGLIYAG